VASTRRIVNDLRPQSLEDLGLVPALENLLGQFSQRTGVACELDVEGDTADALMASPAVTTCLYRVTQEALNNVAKHAQASAVQVRLATAAGGQVWLRIHDNGRGMSTAERHRPESFGLLGMHERVRALGGVVRVDSQPGAGTTLEVLVPLAARELAVLDEHAAAAAGADPATRAAPPLQELIDALEEHVAVCDRQGVIRLVNRAWREFAERNGDPGMRACGPGVNYLEVCRRSAVRDAEAMPVVHGLRAVIDGSLPTFVAEYPCHSPYEQRWFRMHASAMADGSILVTHYRLTLPIDAR
jgi:PAS domain-containing protein